MRVRERVRERESGRVLAGVMAGVYVELQIRQLGFLTEKKCGVACEIPTSHCFFGLLTLTLSA